MTHDDHVRLIADGVRGAGPEWADFGAGEGAFTLALADLLGAAARIHSVDRDAGALDRQEREMRYRFPQAQVTYLQRDFTRRLQLPPLDGIVMANSLHYHRRKEPLLALVMCYLRPRGRLVLVEYDTDRGNLWVPYPLSYETWCRLATRAGFVETRLLARLPSRFLGRIYSAASFTPIRSF